MADAQHALADDAALYFADQVNALQAEIERLTSVCDTNVEARMQWQERAEKAERERDEALMKLALVKEERSAFRLQRDSGLIALAEARKLLGEPADGRGAARGAELLAVLAWYADVKNYDEDTGAPGRLVGGGWAGTEPQEADWEADYGERARNVLGLPNPWEAPAEQGEEPAP